MIFQNIVSQIQDSEERNIRAVKEVKIFTSRLTWLILKNNLNDFIKVVEIPNFEDIQKAAYLMK